MRDRRHVRDRDHLQSVRLKRANGSLAARARPLDKHLQRTHTVLKRLACHNLGCDLRGVWSTLARAFEAVLPSARPADHIARRIGHRHNRIIEGALDMRLAARNILLLAPLTALALRRSGGAG